MWSFCSFGASKSHLFSTHFHLENLLVKTELLILHISSLSLRIWWRFFIFVFGCWIQERLWAGELIYCASMTMGCFVSSEFLWSIGFICFRSLLKTFWKSCLSLCFCCVELICWFLEQNVWFSVLAGFNMLMILDPQSNEKLWWISVPSKLQ